MTTTVQLLELLFTARNPNQWDTYNAELRRHTLLEPTPTTHAMALDIQQRLWHSGRMRSVGVVDCAIAAIALRYNVTVVHYDADFDHIKTVVPEFRHEWVAQKGTL
ncbi:putative nucleic acid-binding protein [Nocardia goodfellowii]|uniref:Nucleic acid-binding protein n=1 Tax=Nocardia goodfellowii TaxID=882446 RepID=A0ABS4QQV2_9NOCA|nr:putative nucleic acid-binding protein [Nocardia goodfellowii]